MAASRQSDHDFPMEEEQTLEIDVSANTPSSSNDSTVYDQGAIRELGRTYHHYKADSYLFPNDGDEQDRLDLQHKVMLLLLDDKLNWAPLDHQNLRAALDVGTGTGLWAISFARENPQCHVTGTDLSLIQPVGIVPNCSFIREDAQVDWTHDKLFDYIHFRLFCPFVKDIKAIIRKARESLRPGGWMEFQDFTHEINSMDGSHEGTALQAAARILSGVGEANGCDPWAMTHLKRIFRNMNFVEITEKVMPLPVGPWPADPKFKDVGWWHGINMMRALDGLIKFAVKGGMTEEAAHEMIDNAKEEIYNGKMHAQGSVYVVYARKPME